MRSVDEQLDMIIDATMTPEPIRIGITDALGGHTGVAQHGHGHVHVR